LRAEAAIGEKSLTRDACHDAANTPLRSGSRDHDYYYDSGEKELPMKSLKCRAAVAAALALVSASALADADRYILLMKSNSVPQDLARKVQAAGGTLVRTLPQVGIAIVTAERADFASAIARDARVQSVGQAVAHTLPKATSRRAALEAPTAEDDLFETGELWGINRVHAPQAWAAGHTGSHDTVVAVIDTGIATNHPDLAPNVVYTACFVSTGDESNGACTPYPSYSDHGTHVAGTIAGAFGGGRIVGVAPNAALAGYNTFEPIEDCGICTSCRRTWPRTSASRTTC
jgi:subtilisin family serine protease